MASIVSDILFAPSAIGLVPAYEKDRLLVRRFGADGRAAGQAVTVDSAVSLIGPRFASSSLGYPALAMDAQGNMVASWERDSGSDSSTTLLLRRYGANGVALGAATAFNASAEFAYTQSDVAYDASGRFVLAWAAGDGIHTQRFNADGSAADGAVTPGTVNNPGYGIGPKLAVAPSGQYTVMWATGYLIGLQMRVFGANGAPLSDPAPARPAGPASPVTPTETSSPQSSSSRAPSLTKAWTASTLSASWATERCRSRAAARYAEHYNRAAKSARVIGEKNQSGNQSQESIRDRPR
jgi:hypothetical protein